MQFQINWKFKSFVFSIVDVLRLSRGLYLIQKYVTRRSRVDIDKAYNNAIAHLEVLRSITSVNSLFEFGAGKSLAGSLSVSDHVTSQVVVDVAPMLDLRLVESSRDALVRHGRLKASRKIDEIGNLELYRIEYIAPYSLMLPPSRHIAAFDGCVSTNVLEHIPYEELREILRNLRRLVRPGGALSFIIDYTDHYSHTDHTITEFNFLAYDDLTWGRYNHRCHFQNRLRHFDYAELFQQCGFEIVRDTFRLSDGIVLKEVLSKFACSPASWRASSGHFVLKNPGLV